MNFSILTFGCKVNLYESEFMREKLLNNGYVLSENKDFADLFIINTCTVTKISDSKNKKLISRIRRNNPNAVIVMAGCMPQAFPEKIESFKYCDIVLGNAAEEDLISILEKYNSGGEKNRQPMICVKPHDNEHSVQMAVKRFSARSRAFVKIQDGCDRFCSYCIIPYARGFPRSKPLPEIREEISVLANKGYKEIVLVGINLSAYGQDVNFELCDAIELVASEENIERIRIGSIEPYFLNEKNIKKLSAIEKLCPHFHLSLQSGCNKTLKAMNRQYNVSEYFDIVYNIRDVFYNPSVTTDLMVGFPGETEADFEESLNFMNRIKFAKVHVFPFSAREGTEADRMQEQISSEIKNRRTQKMIESANMLHELFLKTQIGKTEPVLFEKKNKTGLWEGYTRNYTRICAVSEENISGKILDVYLKEAYNEVNILGEIKNY